MRKRRSAAYMKTLQKKGVKYYSKLCIRVGQNSLNKRKIVYVNLDTTIYSHAKKRHKKVNHRENEIRDDIYKNESTKSDLLNINDNTDWSWVKANGTNTSERFYTLSDYVDKFIRYKKTKKMRDATIDSYRYALNKFIDCIGVDYLVSDINQENIDEFFEYLEKHKVSDDKTLSESSIDSNLKSISSFLNWCKVRGYIESLPIIELIRPILADKCITEAEYNALQTDVANLRDTLDGLIDELKDFRLWKEAGGDI